MSLIPRWKSLLSKQSRRANDLFNLGKFFEDLEEELESFSQQTGLSVSSDEKKIYVEAHVPGLTARDVDVSIDNNHVLWIKGKKQEEIKDKERKYYRESQSSYSYCVPLWEEIDPEIEPDATCKDGVMKIVFTKKREKQVEAKKIQVKEE